MCLIDWLFVALRADLSVLAMMPDVTSEDVKMWTLSTVATFSNGLARSGTMPLRRERKGSSSYSVSLSVRSLCLFCVAFFCFYVDRRFTHCNASVHNIILTHFGLSVQRGTLIVFSETFGQNTETLKSIEAMHA